MCRRVPVDGAAVGLALDGDADRIGLVDETGRFVSTLEVFSLLALYLLERGDRGPLVKGVTASLMLNKLADKYGVGISEMPVGFKNIGPRFVADDAILGGEESGGYAFRGHIPERDGILSGLYLLEYMATAGLTASGMVRRLFDAVGEHHYQRRDVNFDPGARSAIMDRLVNSPLTELAGMTVRDVDEIDGRRWLVDAGWVAARFSGTEPLLRIYCEAELVRQRNPPAGRDAGAPRRLMANRIHQSSRIHKGGAVMETASPIRRLFANILDALLFVLTLIIGYIIWWLIVLGRGQTPGQAIAGDSSGHATRRQRGMGNDFHTRDSKSDSAQLRHRVFCRRYPSAPGRRRTPFAVGPSSRHGDSAQRIGR